MKNKWPLTRRGAANKGIRIEDSWTWNVGVLTVEWGWWG